MWVAITEQDIEGAITPHENTALRIKLKEETAPDPLGAMIAQVTALFRDAVRSSGKNRLTEDESLVPEGAIFDLVAIIRHRLLTRFDISEISESRAEEYKAALDYIKDVRRGDATVENPFKTEDAPQVIPSMSISDPERKFRWADQDGV